MASFPADWETLGLLASIKLSGEFSKLIPESDDPLDWLDTLDTLTSSYEFCISCGLRLLVCLASFRL